MAQSDVNMAFGAKNMALASDLLAFEDILMLLQWQKLPARKILVFT